MTEEHDVDDTVDEDADTDDETVALPDEPDDIDSVIEGVSTP